MKYIKTYEALTIKQYRPFHREAEKAKYSERYKDIFQQYKDKYAGDRNAYRIFIPLTKKEQKSEAQYNVEQALKSLGIDINDPNSFDYISGRAKYPGAKNSIPIGKILSKKKEWADIFQKFQNDPVRIGKGDDLEICISRHPYDIVGADTDRMWTDCMTLYHYNRFKKEWLAKGSESAADYLKKDIRKGSLIAYLIRKTDRNIQNPLSSISIRPYLNEDNPQDIVFVPDNRMYGLRNMDFSISVFAWCDEVNGNKIGYYKIAKGLHIDNFRRKEGMLCAEVKGRDDIYEFDYDDPRKYYSAKHLPPDPWKDRKLESKYHDDPPAHIIDKLKYKEGDYVELYSFVPRTRGSFYREDELAEIVFVRYLNGHVVYGVQYLGGNPDYWEIPDYDVENEIYRKLEDHEVAALKYNL